MKSLFKSALLAISGTAILASVATAAVSLESSSLAVAFYQLTPGPGGGTVGPNTYIYDLGQASLYRENVGYNVSVTTVNSGLSSGNIASDLVAAFGSNWADSGTIRWMVIGNVGQTDPTVAGDPARTSYYSAARNDFEIFSTLPNISSANRTGLSGAIETFMEATTNEPSGTNPDGTIMSKNEIKSVDEFVPPTASGANAGTYFTIGPDPSQTLATGTIANGPGGLVFEGALDIYRVLHTTSEADLTSGYGTDAIVGRAQYIGTLTLDSAGNLGVIPEPSAALLGVLGAAGICFRRRRQA